MTPLRTRFLEETLPYSGEQLRSLWAYERFGLVGDSAVAFIGPCDVRPEFMRDMEELRDGARIFSENMLHFIIEHFEHDLEKTVLRQRLFIALMAEQLNARLEPPRIRREGGDLYDDDRKLTVSVATASPVSGLIHAGINVSSRNTPVPTRGLDDYALAADAFARDMLAAYAREIAGVHTARCKVRACP